MDKAETTDRITPDTGSDGVTDRQEANTTGTDRVSTDTDGDGLTDKQELNTIGTDPRNADTDNDGLDDKRERDQIKSDPLTADTDSDGASDYREVAMWDTSPIQPDTDGDGLRDFAEQFSYGTDPVETDTDADGITDAAEIHTHGTSPVAADTDGDRIPDTAEIQTYGTNPLSADTDGDTNRDPLDRDPLTAPECGDVPPNVYADTDRLSDKQECQIGTDPASIDTDGDGLTDSEEVANQSTNGAQLPDSHPLVKDIHVTYAPTEGQTLATDSVIDIFASLDVANPVIRSGIQLHLSKEPIQSRVVVGHRSAEAVRFDHLQTEYRDDILGEAVTSRNLLLVVADVQGTDEGRAFTQASFAVSTEEYPRVAAHEILHMTMPVIPGSCDDGIHVCSEKGLLSPTLHPEDRVLSEKAKRVIREDGLVRATD